jgi:carboxyl-terminal processing protease
MKTCAFYICLSMLCPLALMAQSPRSVAVDAFMVTRMAEKFHTQPRPLDAIFSAGFFSTFLRDLDGEHFLFLAGDLSRFEPYRLKLGEQVGGQRTDFLDLVTSVYTQRIRQADSLVDLIGSTPLKVALPALGKRHVDAPEDTTAPLNLGGMRAKIATLMAAAEMSYLQRDQDSGWRDTEAAERRRVKDMVKRNIRGMTQSPGGLVRTLELLYCNALAGCYDPHTEFFSTTEKEEFEQELGSRHFVFGFAMKEQGSGVVIDRVQPGSPAFRTGVFSKGDQLTSVQWAGKEPIDLSDASMDEVNEILDASNHDQATFVVKKADGTVRQVSLSKEAAPEDGEEGNRVKGWVLKGAQNIGYISLPAF